MSTWELDPDGEAGPTGIGCQPQAHGQAMPGERRSPCPLCGRPRCWDTIRHGERKGERCRHNPVPGGWTCRYHGSEHPDARQAGLARRAEERVARSVEGSLLGADVESVTDPVGFAQQLLGRLGHAVGMLDGAVGSVTDSDGNAVALSDGQRATIAALTPVLQEARRLSTDLARLDVMGRAVALEERHRDLMVELMGLALDGILDGLKAGALRLLVDVDGASAAVERGWPVLVGEVVPAEIRRLETGGGT